MKIIFCIHTPAHVHFFKNAIKDLVNAGEEVKILARDNGPTLKLLEEYNLPYDIYIKQTARLKSLKSFQIFPYVYHEYRLARKFGPDMVVGIGPDEPIFAALLGKPCILFNDSEPLPFQHLINRTLADAILTPACFNRDLGRKQVRYAGYKELAYLHPRYFSPDPAIFSELKVNQGQPYIILRLNAFNAFHDVGKHGFSVPDQFRLVKELGKYARVFISPEGNLPGELEVYRLPIPYNRIHHALYYAHLLVTDTQTMATEAAILGCPVVRSNSWVGPHDMGNFIELEQKYDLIYSFTEPEMAVQKALELIKRPDLKIEWAQKKQKLLDDKIDVTWFMVAFIENFPESLRMNAKEQR